MQPKQIALVALLLAYGVALCAHISEEALESEVERLSEQAQEAMAQKNWAEAATASNFSVSTRRVLTFRL